MTRRLPGSFCSAASGSSFSHALLIPRCSLHQQLRFQHARAAKAVKSVSSDYSPKSALIAIESKSISDRVNGPRSTLPPPLTLPKREDASSTPIYWFRIGRAYGQFYKEGIKAVWFNYKAAKLLKERITKELGAKDPNEAASKRLISRSEWQLLVRNNHDIGKLPFFGVLVLVFGEWLPLIVPFIPAAVPGTCRIPKQVVGMRETAEKRRQTGFRRGVSEPDNGALPKFESEDRMKWPMASRDYVRQVLATLRHDQLYHLSVVLNNHNRVWDLVQLPPPGWLLRSGLSKKLQYIALDDRLLLKLGKEDAVVKALEDEELAVACEERGLDVSQWPQHTVRDNLAWWLKRSQGDQGRGRAMLTMLFRRLAMRDWIQMNLQANQGEQAERVVNSRGQKGRDGSTRLKDTQNL